MCSELTKREGGRAPFLSSLHTHPIFGGMRVEGERGAEPPSSPLYESGALTRLSYLGTKITDIFTMRKYLKN